MISRDPRCVFVADDAAKASVVANWLELQGVSAQVMDSMTLGGLEGLTSLTGVSARGIEVWVANADDVDRANSLILEHEELRLEAASQDSSARPVLVFCENCGCTTQFSSGQRNTTQPCEQCGKSMNIADDEKPDVELGNSNLVEGSVTVELRKLQKPMIMLFLGCIGLFLLLKLSSCLVLVLGGL